MHDIENMLFDGTHNQFRKRYRCFYVKIKFMQKNVNPSPFVKFDDTGWPVQKSHLLFEWNLKSKNRKELWY